jgi:hypothetical protein
MYLILLALIYFKNLVAEGSGKFHLFPEPNTQNPKIQNPK